MTLEFFFECNEDRRSYNFRNLIKHINDYLEKHPDLEFNKIEHCDPNGYEVYAVVSFKENEKKIEDLKNKTIDLISTNSKLEEEVHELKYELNFAKEAMLSKSIVNWLNEDTLYTIQAAIPDGHPARDIIENIISMRHADISGSISSLDGGVNA